MLREMHDRKQPITRFEPTATDAAVKLRVALPDTQRGISGDVVELVELLGPAVFQYLVNIEKARTPQHDARNVLEPTEGFGRASCLLLLSGKMWKLSKVIPVIQQRPLLFVDGWRWDGARQSGGPGRADGNRKLRGFGRNQVQASFTFRLPTGQIR